MSYCVNCGVKLEASLKRCPLCNTPVVNPNELTNIPPVSPFSPEKGQVEVVKRKDLAILLSVTLSAIALVCGLLNLMVFSSSAWSLYVIGACLLLWVFAIPAMINTKLSLYSSLLLDGLAVALYLYLISFNTANRSWLFGLGLPLTMLLCVLAILFVFLTQKVSSAFLMKALYIFIEIAVTCSGIELMINHFLQKTQQLTWSAIILAICAVVVVSLITILSRARLRNAIRRRFHF